MQRPHWRMCMGVLLSSLCFAQSATDTVRVLTWQDAKREFQANNPALAAGKLSIDEARADEITAFLRPNPDLSLTADDLGLFRLHPFQPTANAILAGSVSYLVERQHKRQLRLRSAQAATEVSVAAQDDLERTLLFTVRDAFVRVLLSKAVRDLANEDLNYYDQVIRISRTRFELGDLAKVDLQRIELQRAQYQSDLQSAEVNLRTAKIDLAQVLNDKTPLDRFDVTGSFEPHATALSLTELHRSALDNRPDLREAQRSVEKARLDHHLAIANGAADPTFSVDVGRQPPLAFYSGISMNVPLRIFDKNQGEKARTAAEITRTQFLASAAQTAIFHDVDSAYASLQSTFELIVPYQSTYLKEADEVRATVSYAYEHGAASLLDFLDAQRQYRTVRLSYLSLVGAYLSGANQLNLAVGQEVMQ